MRKPIEMLTDAVVAIPSVAIVEMLGHWGGA